MSLVVLYFAMYNSKVKSKVDVQDAKMSPNDDEDNDDDYGGIPNSSQTVVHKGRDGPHGLY